MDPGAGASRQRATEAVREWLGAHTQLASPSQCAKVAFISASFVDLCSPRDATHEELNLAAKFVALFFLLDDADTVAVAEHRDHVDRMIAAPDAEPRAPFDRLLSSISHELRAANAPDRLFFACWRDTCAAIEKERRTGGEMVSLEELCEVRQDSAAAHPYIHLWFAMRRLDLREDELRATLRLRRLAVEQIMLCNDLGSIDKDMKEGAAEPNYALFVLRERGLPSIEAAVDDLVERYNRQIDTLAAERRALLAQHPGDRMAQLLNLVLMSVDGNWQATKEMLRLRYTDRGLDRLRQVEVPVNPSG